ncbi:hypothetical protein GN244_ATG00624 [Phytophthora infestans]|uniref:RxLR effector protein n=1 Tax=Phytophthora infestans TaxID=4787 RepID=A0A833TPS8_PHYIN|nr:hypothetical protein GN244_ATG00624 [Phytophthora infestans]
MRVLYLALMATATVQVQSPAFGLATPSVDTAQTATSILPPVLTGKPSTDAATRFLRTHPIEDDHDSDNGEARLLDGIRNKLSYYRGKMSPDQLYKYLGLEGLGPNAYKHKNYDAYIKKSTKWRNNQ